MEDVHSPCQLLRPVWMEVDLDALFHNVQEIRRVIGTNRKLQVVAKADAYGHGVSSVAQTLLEAGANSIAVGNLDHAVQLREANINAPLVLLGSSLPDAANTVIEYRVIPTIWDEPAAKAYSKAAKGPVSVALEIDTGFHRLGVLPEDATKLALLVGELPNLNISFVYTHFADPLEWEFVREQYDCFMKVLHDIRAAGVAVPYAMAASSVVVSMYPDMYLDGVDVGHLVYGFYLPYDPIINLDLKPVARAVKSRLIQVKCVDPGKRIGAVNPVFVDQPTLTGVATIGLYDGLLLRGGEGAAVLVRGKRCPIVGAVSLEHCQIDLRAVPEAEPGDEVVLFGEQQGSSISLREHAAWAGTSESHVVIQFGRRVPRLYFKNEQLVKVE